MPPLLTIDIWDTLLRRTCHPDEIKLVSAKRMLFRFGTILKKPYTVHELFDLRVQTEREIGRENAASGNDDEYEIEDVFARLLFSVLNAAQIEHLGAPGIRDHAVSLANAEAHNEKSVCSLDPAGADIVRSTARYPETKVVAISDFYMSEPRLRQILDAVAPDISSMISRIYVSCDVGLNKRSGRIFAYVRKELGIDPADHTHVGDNEWSDVKMARKSGATARRFTFEPFDAKRATHEKRFAQRINGDMRATVALISDALARTQHVPDDLTSTQQRLYTLGRRYAPVFAGLVLHASERAYRVGAKSIHYFTREGEFFAQVHTQLQESYATSVPMQQPVVLEVSRIATFFPSLREITLQELMRLWNQYSQQSMGQLFSSLGIQWFSAEPFLSRHSLGADEIIRYPWKDQRVIALFNDRVFLRFVEQIRDERRELLSGYLAAKGLAPNTKQAVIVDIGWRGTIQDNIAYMLPGTQVNGVYLGLQRLLNTQPDNVHKQAFGPDARRDPPAIFELLRNVAPYEMLTNAPTGSVRGYERDGDSIVAHRVNDDGEDHVHHAYIGAFQQGALDAMPDVARVMRIHAMTSDDIRPQCIQLLREIAQSPDPALASAFFSLVHNETFGVGGFVDKRFQLSKELVTQARTSNEGWQKMVAFLESTSWPCGFLRLHGLDDLHDRYLNRVERHVAMQSIWPYKVLQRARASKLGRMVPEKIIPKSLVKRALGLQQPDATIEAKPSPQTESQTASSASTHAVKH